MCIQLKPEGEKQINDQVSKKYSKLNQIKLEGTCKAEVGHMVTFAK